MKKLKVGIIKKKLLYINMEEENKYLENFYSFAVNDQFNPNVDIENIYSKECPIEGDCDLNQNDFHHEFEDYTYEQIKNQYAFGTTNELNEQSNKTNSLLCKIFGETIEQFEDDFGVKHQKQEVDVAEFFYLGNNKNSKIGTEHSNLIQPIKTNFEYDENMDENIENQKEEDIISKESIKKERKQNAINKHREK